MASVGLRCAIPRAAEPSDSSRTGAFWEHVRTAHSDGDGPRAYHTWQHIVAFSAALAELYSLEGETVPAESVVAMSFHDIVYDAALKDNEARSAAAADAAIAEWGLAADAGAVRRLIMLTAVHGRMDAESEAALTVHERRFLDADLAILGAPPSAYDAYEAACEAEYVPRAFPRWKFVYGRLAFLRGLHAKAREGKLYLSGGAFARERSQRAEVNLAHATRGGAVVGFCRRFIFGWR